MTERTNVDTSGYETPESLYQVMGVYELGNGKLARAKFVGHQAPEQVAFNLPKPIQFPDNDRWTDIDGNTVHAFWRYMLGSYVRYLMPSNSSLKGAASVYPWCDSLHARGQRMAGMCPNPNGDLLPEYGWAVVDIHADKQQAHVFLGDWDSCLFEFINASHADLIRLARQQLAEESNGLLPKMNKVVTVHRDHKLKKLDDEWRAARKLLVEQWAAQQFQLVRAEEAQWHEANDRTRVYGLVLGSNNDKTPIRSRSVKDVLSLMARHERDHGLINATILWTVKETDVDDAGVWHKYATYDADRSVWTLLF